MVKRRNRDCIDIFKGMRSLGAQKQPGTRHLDPTIGFHHVFFFGDLNYRIGAPLDHVLDAIEKADTPVRAPCRSQAPCHSQA
eukprot:5074027-Prymnesium_polylepis.1